MGLGNLLANTSVLDDLMHDFEGFDPSVDDAVKELMKKYRVPTNEQGAIFGIVASRTQEILVRQTLLKLSEDSSGIYWDVVEEGDSKKYHFEYKHGALEVKVIKKEPKAKIAKLHPHTEIDFHGLVEGIPVSGEVKMGYQSMRTKAMKSKKIKDKIRPLKDVFNTTVAYVAIIPKDQIRTETDLMLRISPALAQHSFTKRGGYLVAFPFERYEWYGAVLETAQHLGIDFDYETLPIRMRIPGIIKPSQRILRSLNPGFA